MQPHNTNNLTRRRFLKLSAITLTGTMISACAPAARPSTTTDAAAEAQAPSEEVIELRLHDRTIPGKIEYFERLGERFAETHPNIQVKVEAFPGGVAYNEKILTGIAGDTIGDLAWSVNVENYPMFLSKGIIEPIQPWVDAENYDLSIFIPEMVDLFRHEGTLYVLPNGGIHGGPLNLYYNEDLLAKAGVDAPPDLEWTYDDLVDLALSAANPDEKIFGYAVSTRSSENLHMFIRSFGGDSINAEGTESRLLEEPVRQAFAFLDKMVNELRLIPRPTDLPPEGGERQLFISQLAATYSGLPLNTATLRSGIGDAFSWTTSLVPVGPAGRISQSVASVYFMPKAAKQKDAAWEFTKAMSTLEEELIRPQVGFSSSARKDALLHPDLMEDPIYKLYHEWFAENPSPAPAIPANNRIAEFYDLFNTGFDGLWLGEQSVDEALEEVDRQLTVLLQKPEP